MFLDQTEARVVPFTAWSLHGQHAAEGIYLWCIWLFFLCSNVVGEFEIEGWCWIIMVYVVKFIILWHSVIRAFTLFCCSLLNSRVRRLKSSKKDETFKLIYFFPPANEVKIDFRTPSFLKKNAPEDVTAALKPRRKCNFGFWIVHGIGNAVC